MSAASQNRPTLLARVTALAAILMVLALSVLASSPELHAKVHAHEAAAAPTGHAGGADQDEDGGCVVTLFAQGILALLAFLCLASAGQRVRAAGFAPRRRVLPEGPAYLFLPTQAPPAA